MIRVVKSGGSILDGNYPAKWVSSGWTSTLYNIGIVDVFHRYPKMYVVRP